MTPPFSPPSIYPTNLGFPTNALPFSPPQSTSTRYWIRHHKGIGLRPSRCVRACMPDHEIFPLLQMMRGRGLDVGRTNGQREEEEEDSPFHSLFFPPPYLLILFFPSLRTEEKEKRKGPLLLRPSSFRSPPPRPEKTDRVSARRPNGKERRRRRRKYLIFLQNVP